MQRELKLKSDQEELVIVVDENDNVIDYVPRSVAHKNKLLHRTISILVFNKRGQLLLQKRSMKKDNNPGMMANAVGGHVEKGESYEKAAYKEMSEEINISGKITLIKKMILEDPAHRTMTSIYKIISEGPFKFDPEETDEIKFYSKDQLKNIEDKLSGSARIILKEQGLI